MTKKKKEPESNLELRVSYDQSRYIIEEGSDSNEPYSYRGVDGINVKFHHLRITEKGSPYNWKNSEGHIYGEIESDFLTNTPETATIVVARYASGDSFGRTEGQWSIDAVFRNYSDAIKWEKDNQTTMADNHNDYFGGFSGSETYILPVIK